MFKLKFFSTTIYPEGDALELFPMPILTKGGTSIKDGKINRMTTVILEQGVITHEDGKEIFEGGQIGITTVTRYFKDFDIPVLGQKLALEKLINKGSFSREERKEIWEAFWNYSNKTNSLRSGAYKNEIKHMKQEDIYRRWFKDIKIVEDKIPAVSNEAMKG